MGQSMDAARPRPAPVGQVTTWTFRLADGPIAWDLESRRAGAKVATVDPDAAVDREEPAHPGPGALHDVGRSDSR